MQGRRAPITRLIKQAWLLNVAVIPGHSACCRLQDHQVVWESLSRFKTALFPRSLSYPTTTKGLRERCVPVRAGRFSSRQGFVDPCGPRLSVWLAASAVNSHCSESVSIWQVSLASRAAGETVQPLSSAWS